MDRRKILYLGGFRLPDKNAAAHRVVSNGKIMRALGFDIVFLGFRDVDDTDAEVLRQDESYFGFECWSMPYPASMGDWVRNVFGCGGALEFLRRMSLESVAAVILYNYPAVAQLRVASKCRARSVKVVSDATEWYDASGSGGAILSRCVKWLDTALRMNFVHWRAHGVMTTSRYLTDYYGRKGRPIIQLPTLYDTDRFRKPESIPERRLRKFIYMGSPFIPERVSMSRKNVKERLDKCIELFFQLYEDNEPFVFDIYGLTRENYLSVYPEQQKILDRMQDQVVFHGREQHRRLLEKIAASDFSIFFRDKNRVTLAGFPSKLAESISCGTPVLSNEMLSLEPYRSENWMFLTNGSDSLSLAKGLIRLSSHEISELKLAAFESKYFDYRNFQEPVAEFLDALGINGDANAS